MTFARMVEEELRRVYESDHPLFAKWRDDVALSVDHQIGLIERAGALADESVVFCFCDQVLEHVPDLGAVVAEIDRVLRKGGAAYLGMPNRLALVEAHTVLLFAHWLPHRAFEWYVKWRDRYPPQVVWDVRTRTYWTLRRELRRQGFAVVGTLSHFLPVWQRRWSRWKSGLAGAHMALSLKLGLTLDPLAPAIAMAVVKKAR